MNKADKTRDDKTRDDMSRDDMSRAFPPITPLAHHLAERIRRNGPLSLTEYMAAALGDPEHGYYMTRPAIGGSGDFVTAPEISQCFGEIVGLWAAVTWQQMGAPSPFALVEMGPGRGTMLADALRASSRVLGFRDAARLHLIETSRRARAEQTVALARVGATATWHDDPADPAIPIAPTILLANEFLDALPVEQIVLREDGWRRVAIGLDAEGGLTFVDGAPAEPPPARSTATARLGDRFERQQAVRHLIADVLAARARRVPTVALFIDYGHTESAFGDTLQAVRGHHADHPLAHPGEADLTVQVDFAALTEIARAAGLVVHGPVLQGDWLGRLGIVERASRLMAANPAKALTIEADVRRLLEPMGMGGRFKSLAIGTAGLPTPAGFEIDKRAGA